MTENQESWLKALESDEFKQAIGLLENKGRFCCLGVACILAGRAGLLLNLVTSGHSIGELLGGNLTSQPGVQEWLGLLDACGLPYGKVGMTETVLTKMNDSGKSFKEIAKTIRANPEAYFVNSEPREVAPSSRERGV
jgi:hypothetical protein